MLVSQTPGGAHERFFDGAGRLADGDGGSLAFERQRDMADTAEIATRYGVEISPRAPK